MDGWLRMLWPDAPHLITVYNPRGDCPDRSLFSNEVDLPNVAGILPIEDLAIGYVGSSAAFC